MPGTFIFLRPGLGVHMTPTDALLAKTPDAAHTIKWSCESEEVNATLKTIFLAITQKFPQ